MVSSAPLVAVAPCATHDLYVFMDGQPAEAVVVSGNCRVIAKGGHAVLRGCPQSVDVCIGGTCSNVALCSGPSTIVDLFTVSCRALDFYGNTLDNATLYLDGSISASTTLLLRGSHLFQYSFGGLMFDLGWHEIVNSCSIEAKLAVSDLSLQIFQGSAHAPDGTFIDARSNSTGAVHNAITEGGRARFHKLPFGTYNVSADGAWALIVHNSSLMRRLTLNSPKYLDASIRNCYLLLPSELSIRMLDCYGEPVSECRLEILQKGFSTFVTTDHFGKATLLIPPSLTLHESIVVIGADVQEELLIDRNPAPVLMISCGIAMIAYMLAKHF